MNPNQPITGYELNELEEICLKSGETKYTAKQIMDWIYKKGAASFESMTNLSIKSRSNFSGRFAINSSHIKETLTSFDGTNKFIIELADKLCVECVLISEDNRLTLCISTQVGCPVKCKFCASGQKGLIRSLHTNEIVEEVLLVKRSIKDKGLNIVVMGMGEPFLNYDNLIKALKIITAGWGMGIGKNRITVSTIGLPDKIEQFAGEPVATNLAISLHSPNDEIRAKIIPMAKKATIKEIIQSVKKYHQITRKDITFEYLMIDELNSDEISANELAKLIKDTGGKINLIPYNEVKGLSYKTPLLAAVMKFQNILRSAGLIAMIRKSKGQDIGAACGQLLLK